MGKKLHWMRLDNAAKLYPAVRSDRWSNIFRLSATLIEEVDKAALERALDTVVHRFPSMAVRLRKGVFWYYLQQMDQAPPLSSECSYPLTRMSRQEVRRCAFRVIAYENRIAVEMFHSLTDGTGALIFLKTLVAEYLRLKYGVSIPCEQGVLDAQQTPDPREWEDSFLRYAGPVAGDRREDSAWRVLGTPEVGGFQHLTCLKIPVDKALAVAKSHGVSLTCLVASAMLMALQTMQREQIHDPRRRKMLRVQIPVNLRSLFPSVTLRNFALYTTPQMDPRLGWYTLPEIEKIVQSWMHLTITPKFMAKMMATNVSSEQLLIVRVLPLFLKNMVMKAIFRAVGEKKSCLSLSNLGAVKLPEEMAKYVQRMDFILGVQETAPYNVGVISYGDTLYINFIRDIRESELEYQFFCVLRDLGLPVTAESNQEGICIV